MLSLIRSERDGNSGEPSVDGVEVGLRRSSRQQGTESLPNAPAAPLRRPGQRQAHDDTELT